MNTKWPMLATTFACAAQALAQNQDQVITARLARAEALLQEKRNDEACALLLTTRRAAICHVLESAHGECYKRIDKLLATADPNAARTRTGYASAARHLVDLAKRRQRAKAYRDALDLAFEAERLDPKIAARALGGLHRAAPKEFRLAVKADAHAGRRARKPTFDPSWKPAFAGWKTTPDAIQSPPVGKDTMMVLSNGHHHSDARVSVEILRADERGSAALVFGARSSADFFVYTLFTVGGNEVDWAIDYYRIPPEELRWKHKRLAVAALTLRRVVRTAWCRLSVEIVGDRGTAFLNDKKLGSFTCPRKAWGMAGLNITGSKKPRQPVQFRRLTIGPIVRNEEDPKQIVARFESVDSANATDNQTKIIALRGLRRRLPGIRDATSRNRLASDIERTLADALPRHAIHKKIRAAAAAALLGVAKNYHDAGWKHCERLALRDAAALSLETAGPLLPPDKK